MYTGKEKNITEHGLGANVVHTLTEDLHNTHRHVYFDNYFSGVDLLGLLQNGLYGYGMLRSNRKGFLPQLKDAVKKGFKESGQRHAKTKISLFPYGKITSLSVLLPPILTPQNYKVSHVNTRMAHHTPTHAQQL